MSSTPRTVVVLSLALAASAAASVSCTDPVRDNQIAQLGDEDPAVPQGPEHRPGQPCVVCHSAGGPASNAPFVVAGTVFATKGKADGADGVTVFLVDSVGARRSADTNGAGNFFVTESDWKDISFPIKAGIKKDKDQEVMNTTINREGSCNFCHKPGQGTYDAIAQVYLKQ